MDIYSVTGSVPSPGAGVESTARNRNWGMAFLTGYDKCDRIRGPDNTMTEHFPPRTSKRAPIETRVRFRFADLEDFEVRQSGDLSLGGMFLKGSNPPPSGTRVDFEFVLTDATELIRGTGEVVWSRNEDAGPDQPAGMGIRFLKLSPGSRAIIFHAVDRWIQEGGEPFDVEKEISATSAETETVPTAELEQPSKPEARPSVLPELSDLGNLPDPTATTEEPPVEAPSVHAATESPEPEPHEPLSELVARTTGAEPRAASAEVFDPSAVRSEPRVEPQDDPGELSSTRVGGVAFVRDEDDEIRWGRLAVIAAVVILVAAAVSFVWLQDHDPSPSSTETSEAVGLVSPPEDVTTPAVREEQPSDSGVSGEEAPDVAQDEPSGEPGADPQTVASILEESEASDSAASLESPGQPVTRIREISWNRSDDGTEVVLVGDGSFELQRWAHFALGGENPREVVKIRGILGPYERSFLPVGSPELRQVRTGFHTLPGSNELHVVLDLADSRVEATRVEADGRTLRIRLTGPRS